ncbi:TPA: 30S ribosomal protein S19 [Candidatus Peribacteria bacterium]|jgi:small subunit ribosomal protein S19|nr:MAG: 30S ribosomal protein S19 [Candidatus Peribacteria bacterium RIFOXYC2_FULL_58_10]OGJ84926.1 MAG: 30S ribosomal protein S19 [Candidatus Peribacteria bacterium RIFOXYD2_FULL_58_15]HAI99002.1 30S ribosomal protein S19 [Candidatus Peribacteria bacterium]HAS34807.1 30S ribosomal protein S19 [Candidatus Peribacteria bacterium]
MSRSISKGPYINERLLKKVMKMAEAGEKKIIKTWARNCDIPPEFVGYTFAVHNGKEFVPVYVTEQMVGHKLGEFSWTTKFKSHGGKLADAKAAAAAATAAAPAAAPKKE